LAVQSVLSVDVRKIIEFLRRKLVELSLNYVIPDKVIEVSLEPELDILFIRLDKPEGKELGEPIEPFIHVFNDGRKITAIEIVNAGSVLKHKGFLVR